MRHTERLGFWPHPFARIVCVIFARVLSKRHSISWFSLAQYRTADFPLHFNHSNVTTALFLSESNSITVSELILEALLKCFLTSAFAAIGHWVNPMSHFDIMFLWMLSAQHIRRKTSKTCIWQGEVTFKDLLEVIVLLRRKTCIKYRPLLVFSQVMGLSCWVPVIVVLVRNISISQSSLLFKVHLKVFHFTVQTLLVVSLVRFDPLLDVVGVRWPAVPLKSFILFLVDP